MPPLSMIVLTAVPNIRSKPPAESVSPLTVPPEPTITSAPFARQRTGIDHLQAAAVDLRAQRDAADLHGLDAAAVHRGAHGAPEHEIEAAGRKRRAACRAAGADDH